MSKLNRGDRIALIVLTLALFTIIACVWISQPSHSQEASQTDQQSNSENRQGQGVDAPHLGIFTPADTYAQWIMAVLSLVATGISAWAVVLIRDTLVETRKAVKAADAAVEVTLEVGHLQTRAWLGFHGWGIEAWGEAPKVDHYIFQIEWKNYGHSPAIETSLITDRSGIEKFKSANPFEDIKTKVAVPPNAVPVGGQIIAFTPEEIFAMAETPASVTSIARYRTVGGGDEFQTSRIELDIGYIGRQGLEDLKIGKLSPTNLRVQIVSGSSTMT